MDLREAILGELQARLRAGTLSIEMNDRAGPNPAVTGEELASVEARLGIALPPFLRSIYTTIGNGGFGPGHGLMPLEESSGPMPRCASVVAVCESFRSPCTKGPPWGKHLLPFCNWGCGIYAYVDCSLSAPPVMAIDPNLHGTGPCNVAVSLHAQSLEEWMQRWLQGEKLWDSIGLSGEPIFGYEEHPEEAARFAAGGHEEMMRRIEELVDRRSSTADDIVRPFPPSTRR